MIKQFTLSEMLELHKLHPNLMFEYFMDNYCNKLLEDNYGLKIVEVIFSEKVSLKYYKTKLEIA
jgi:hypothetical protein